MDGVYALNGWCVFFDNLARGLKLALVFVSGSSSSYGFALVHSSHVSSIQRCAYLLIHFLFLQGFVNGESSFSSSTTLEYMIQLFSHTI